MLVLSGFLMENDFERDFDKIFGNFSKSQALMSPNFLFNENIKTYIVYQKGFQNIAENVFILNFLAFNC